MNINKLKQEISKLKIYNDSQEVWLEDFFHGYKQAIIDVEKILERDSND